MADFVIFNDTIAVKPEQIYKFQLESESRSSVTLYYKGSNAVIVELPEGKTLDYVPEVLAIVSSSAKTSITWSQAEIELERWRQTDFGENVLGTHKLSSAE